MNEVWSLHPNSNLSPNTQQEEFKLAIVQLSYRMKLITNLFSVMNKSNWNLISFID